MNRIYIIIILLLSSCSLEKMYLKDFVDEESVPSDTDNNDNNTGDNIGNNTDDNNSGATEFPLRYRIRYTADGINQRISGNDGYVVNEVRFLDLNNPSSSTADFVAFKNFDPRVRDLGKIGEGVGYAIHTSGYMKAETPYLTVSDKIPLNNYSRVNGARMPFELHTGNAVKGLSVIEGGGIFRVRFALNFPPNLQPDDVALFTLAFTAGNLEFDADHVVVFDGTEKINSLTNRYLIQQYEVRYVAQNVSHLIVSDDRKVANEIRFADERRDGARSFHSFIAYRPDGSPDRGWVNDPKDQGFSFRDLNWMKGETPYLDLGTRIAAYEYSKLDGLTLSIAVQLKDDDGVMPTSLGTFIANLEFPPNLNPTDIPRFTIFVDGEDSVKTGIPLKARYDGLK
ncbi:MAG: hypothetical protein ACRCY4_08975 [Brevinema sp.]